MKNIQYLLFSLFILLTTVACHKSTETLDVRMEKCLENSTQVGFEIVGSDKKGLSHTVDTECILGAYLPIFELYDLNINAISERTLQGKINVINFWFTKCKPCVAEIPFLNDLQTEYKNNNVNFIAITPDGKDEIEIFLQSTKFDFHHLINGKEIIDSKFRMIWGYPFTIVTDKNNQIVAAINGVDSKEFNPSKITKEIKALIEKYK